MNCDFCPSLFKYENRSGVFTETSQLTQFEHPEPHARISPLERGINFRDMGGYTGAAGRRVRWRHVFRSGSTYLMNDEDRTALTAVPIRAVVDLRSRRERADHPHILCGHGDVDYQAFEHDHAAGNILRMLASPDAKAGTLQDMMIRFYAELPYQFSASFRALFVQAATGPLPLMFNCTAGKDRTGVAAALLLSALGVEWHDVLADYLLTERFVPVILQLYAKMPRRRTLEHHTPELLAPVFGVQAIYLDSMLRAIALRSGSLENYFRNTLNLDEEFMHRLQERLLD